MVRGLVACAFRLARCSLEYAGIVLIEFVEEFLAVFFIIFKNHRAACLLSPCGIPIFPSVFVGVLFYLG
jgi:hypothetical protein